MRKTCDNCKYDVWDYVGHKPCENCVSKGNEPPSFWEASENYTPMTNADRIRAMSDEELAWELMTWRLETEAKHHGVESNYPNTQKSILEWLKQPAEVDNG